MTDLLWQLADRWEDRFRDKRGYSPIARYVWKQAWEELTGVLGPREARHAWKRK